MLEQSLEDWSESPVITTLDSIASPIHNVQFPTVTICTEDHYPVDNWGPIEKLLNHLAFECYDSRKDPFPNCSESVSLRTNFDQVIRDMQKEMLKIIGNTSSIMFLSDPINLISLENGLGSNNLSINGIENAMIAEFAKTTVLKEFLQNTFSWKGSSVSTTIDPNIRNKAKKLYVLGMTMLNTDQKMPFGHFTSHFADLSTLSLSEDKWSNLEVCSKATSMDKRLHDYFQSLSRMMGFNDSVNVSIFDIPSMLANLDNFKTILQVIKESFTFTQCQQNNQNFAFENCFFQWNQYVKGKMAHPCEKNDTVPFCCHAWSKLLGHDLTPIMRIMRLASRRGRPMMNNQEIQSLMNSTINKFPVNPIGVGHYLKDVSKDPTSIIIKSNFKGQSNDALFSPVLTNKGLCHAFNAYPIQKVLKVSSFQKSFTEAFKHDLDDTYQDKIMGEGIGTSSGLEVYLDANSLWRPAASKSSFLISLSGHLDYFDAKSFLRLAKPGYKTIIDIQPLEVIATSRLRDLAPTQRKCRFSNEADGLTIFSKYSQSACQLECIVKQAYQTCQCIPWNMPTNESNYVICDIYGTFCFNEILKQEERLHGCDCLANCNDIQFNIMEKEVLIDLDEYCTGFGQGDIFYGLKTSSGYNSLLFTFDVMSQAYYLA